ncbi:MAG: winged helix-turn-helix domain-containing protein [Acidobacteria bacterium]|nr:winged helix-turn-helix domain-containing protein [Acidobacteriota bacterium]
MQSRLKGLLGKPVLDAPGAEIAAEAARILRDLMRLEQQAEELLGRRAGSSATVAEGAPRYGGAGSFEGLALHDAARRVLAAAGAPLHVRDLGARIKASGWRHPRSSHARPDQIEFQLAARLPRYPAVFRRVAPNTFGLAEWGDVAPPRHPKPRLDAVRGRGPRLARRIADEPDLIFTEAASWPSS